MPYPFGCWSMRWVGRRSMQGRKANCVEKKGSKIKGCVVVAAQTHMAQGFLRLQRRNTDYTLACKPRRYPVCMTTTCARH